MTDLASAPFAEKCRTLHCLILGAQSSFDSYKNRLHPIKVASLIQRTKIYGKTRLLYAPCAPSVHLLEAVEIATDHNFGESQVKLGRASRRNSLKGTPDGTP